jgi:hypothetical protein
MRRMHDMTKDERMAFAGTENFMTGELPLYYEDDVIVIVADQSIIEVYHNEEYWGADNRALLQLVFDKPNTKIVVNAICQAILDETELIKDYKTIEKILKEKFLPRTQVVKQISFDIQMPHDYNYGKLIDEIKALVEGHSGLSYLGDGTEDLTKTYIKDGWDLQ